MKELKRCPFCGGEATIERIRNGNKEIIFVKCKECESASSVFSAPIGMINPRAKIDDPIFAKVINAWNRRTGEP